MFGVTENTLWVESFRPDTLDGYIGNEHIIDKVKIFIENGGQKFGYIPCLNDRDDHILLLTSLLENELHGWV